MKDYQEHILPNGIRILHKQVKHTKVVHCGFMLDIGSRDELADQQGLAHFWEHMAFKGTRKRKAFHILDRLDSVGGELNAYTTKEKICFYASTLDRYFANAFELLTDITFDSIFPERQIENERGVILEEMAMYKDNPEDAIQDDFDNLVFRGHPMGKNILGTVESVKSFHKKDFQRFISQNLNTERVVFSVVGNISLQQVLKAVNKHLKDIPHYDASRQRKTLESYRPIKESSHRDWLQAQCAMGRTSYPISDSKRLPFFMLVNLLGGPGLNTRLNLALREKYGFVYSIEAYYAPYTDTGLFAIYFGTEPSQLNKSTDLVIKELKKLREKPLGIVQLNKLKAQVCGQLAISEENYVSLMLMMGKSMLDLNRIDNLENVYKKIQRVTHHELQELANDMFNFHEMSYLQYSPN
ncbi:MAG: pitrilysin family protein [Bacteroidetes bacterium]|nr:pitrilysin family protein [Bacteroidota bacterium]